MRFPSTSGRPQPSPLEAVFSSPTQSSPRRVRLPNSSHLPCSPPPEAIVTGRRAL